LPGDPIILATMKSGYIHEI